MKKTIFITAAVSVFSFSIVFGLGFYVGSSVRDADRSKYVVTAQGQPKPIDDKEKAALSELAKEIFHRDDVGMFRCTYGEQGQCQAVLDGKPLTVSIEPGASAKLRDATKVLWGNEGFATLTHIDCALSNEPKCQVFGAVERQRSQLEAGTCISAIIRG